MLLRLVLGAAATAERPKCTQSVTPPMPMHRVISSGESNLRTRVRGFESFGDFRGRKKRFESLAKDSSLFGTCFLTLKIFLQPKNQEFSPNLSFFLVLYNVFFK
jgi:hypothetical protein